MSEPLCLTDLDATRAGVRRVAHGYATSGSWRRLVRRLFQAGAEVALALPRDAWRLVARRDEKPVRIDNGVDPSPHATRIALYVHYSANGSISDMVRCQLGLLRQAGFATVFISMAPDIPDADWQAVRRLCALVVQRRNFGRDFGAWHDLMPEVRRRWGIPQELMLVNDSVMGPIRPLSPVLQTMRAGGEGLFGLTESRQGGPHLQSYLLLAHGRRASADVMRFVETMFVSHSKWLLVQLGEMRLARWMRRRGHRVAAVFGYDRIVRALLADPAERDRVKAANWRLRNLDQLSDDQVSALLEDWPLNPTHHLWHVLAARLDFPFLKTELVARNPGRLPGVADWPSVVPADSPCHVQMLRAHLATLGVA
jgi:Rhamnan synthesis protein F